ncbi:hypothetical protein BOTCAL_0261g00050 [Botryotinia calthae]|uniref:Uncharacterized protein n=1 Tax=Botryotinia calthae TaxID=38488 RepID=A0A4Y8CW29_9HELO|nr:hypothetical protein BOTCAL_0261g00050 [Botryotinia calthae]
MLVASLDAARPVNWVDIELTLASIVGFCLVGQIVGMPLSKTSTSGLRLARNQDSETVTDGTLIAEGWKRDETVTDGTLIAEGWKRDETVTDGTLIAEGWKRDETVTDGTLIAEGW